MPRAAHEMGRDELVSYLPERKGAANRVARSALTHARRILIWKDADVEDVSDHGQARTKKTAMDYGGVDESRKMPKTVSEHFRPHASW